MTTTLKHNLLATTAIAVLGLALAPGAAKAFDTLDWNWDKDVAETVTINTDVTVANEPSGMMEVEKFQWHIGDSIAKSDISNIENNAAGDGSGQGQALVDETLSLEALWSGNATDNPITAVTVGSDNLTGSNADGNVDITDETVFLTFDLDGLVDVVPTDARDAVDLPHVEGVATALGNMQTISSEVATTLHDGQFLVGSVDGGENGGLEIGQGAEELASYDPEDRNFHTDMALALGYANAVGLSEPASIEATQNVSEITNASVSSDATAFGNFTSVDLTAATADDGYLAGDLTQYAHADVKATSKVSDVDINNYSNFGAAGFGAGNNQVPLVSSNATAIGNNLAISVSSPNVGLNGNGGNGGTVTAQ